MSINAKITVNDMRGQTLLCYAFTCEQPAPTVGALKGAPTFKTSEWIVMGDSTKTSNSLDRDLDWWYLRVVAIPTAIIKIGESENNKGVNVIDQGVPSYEVNITFEGCAGLAASLALAIKKSYHTEELVTAEKPYASLAGVTVSIERQRG